MKRSLSLFSKVEEPAAPLDVKLPAFAMALVEELGQRAIPALARNSDLVRQLETVVRDLPTRHDLHEGDSRDISLIPDESIHLVVTSPPYWTLKEYPAQEGQLGRTEGYDDFLEQLDNVWKHCLRVLTPGGRLVVVVGDVCIPRRRFGRHLVLPLHASIQEHCRGLGFDNLAPIIWFKIANAKYESNNGSRFLGKPYEPNAVVKNDIEYVLFQRKPGGYRKPSTLARVLSVIPEQEQRAWFQQAWHLGGTSTRRHPAPFSLPIAERLVRMFSFVGDTILDPFMGTGTTNLAACKWGRNSVGVEINGDYFDMANERLSRLIGPLFHPNLDV